jgi:hypothetical protein
MSTGEAVTVPDAPFTHVFVARSNVELEGAGALGEGDAVRPTGIGGRISASSDAEIVVWKMHASIS